MRIYLNAAAFVGSVIPCPFGLAGAVPKIVEPLASKNNMKKTIPPRFLERRGVGSASPRQWTPGFIPVLQAVEHLCHSGVTGSTDQRGVALSATVQLSLLRCKPISPHLKGRVQHLEVLTVYLPTIEADDATKDAFCMGT